MLHELDYGLNVRNSWLSSLKIRGITQNALQFDKSFLWCIAEIKPRQVIQSC